MKMTTTFATKIHEDPDPVDAANKPDGSGAVLRPSRVCHLTVLATAFCALVFYAHYAIQGNMASALFKPPVTVSSSSLPLPSSTTTIDPSLQPEKPATNRSAAAPASESDHCEGRYIYMYDMPPRFNDDLVRDCGKGELHPWLDMCPYVANDGMGEPLGDEGGVFPGHGWYATDQFTLDLIFHSRMKRSYECLTNDTSLAAAVFVPFYAGLDAGRFLYNHSTSIRDKLQLDFIHWLVNRPEWHAMGGRDHFLVAGRTTWDFRREADVDALWGTKLLTHPAVENMTALVLEKSPSSRNNFAIPYPTYFHPEAAADVVAWQQKVREMPRRWLFSFAGAPRPGSNKTVRAELIRQCGASSLCNLFHCGGGDGAAADCNSPGGVMRVFEGSDFCLQPRGDTATRRSTFDALLAGCVPVFFHRDSAYTQYALHFPRDHAGYSVLIPHAGVAAGRVSIEERLRRIPAEEVRRMREAVIRLIPRVVYAYPGARRAGFKDAFDVAVEAVIDRVAKRRRGEDEETAGSTE